MPPYAYAILVAGWVAWVTPFLRARGTTTRPEKLDRRARWGVLLQGAGYALLWQTRFWEGSPSAWWIVVSVFLFSLAGAFSWLGTRALGRHWRIDAGLDSDHELVRTGVYGIVRHPIYSSMLFALLGTGFMITPLPLLALATLLLLIGTEIRVRIEEDLLAARFGDSFRDYQRSVPAYLPGAKRRWSSGPGVMQ